MKIRYESRYLPAEDSYLADLIPWSAGANQGVARSSMSVPQRAWYQFPISQSTRRRAGDRQWTLIDAGVPGLSGLIESAASERFGQDARPAAIVMTHGHFDHVGVLKKARRKVGRPNLRP